MSDPSYGLVAEFLQPEPLVSAVRDARRAGYHCIQAYSPFPVEELDEALGIHGDHVALLTLIGGILAGGGGFLMQWFANVVSYPINIGGRPLNSWPAFIPVTFELTILGAALSAAFGMLFLNRLPQVHHPIFECTGFERASKDRFFLCIEAVDPLFRHSETAAFLTRAGAVSLQVVEYEP